MISRLFQTFILSTAQMGIFLLFGVIILSHQGMSHYFFELLSHFQLQYFGLSLVLMLIFLGFRTWKWSFAAFVCLAISGSSVIPWYLGKSDQISEQAHLKILHANVLTSNKNHESLLELIKNENPDLIFLQEVNNHWIEALGVLKNDYQFHLENPLSNNFGIAVFSKIEWNEAQLLEMGPYRLPSIFLRFQIDEELVSLLYTHPLPPADQDYFEARNEQLSEVATFLQSLPEQTLLVGDLNTSPWSPYYQKLVNQTQLIPCNRGYGIQPTWPTVFPFLMIPIDHCLATEGIRITSFDTGDDIGSDHLPLLFDIVVSKKE